MRNIPALILVIIGIVAIIAVVGFVIASIAHNYSETDMQTQSELERTRAVPELSQNMYILQLFASKNYSRIEHQKQKLEKAGYNTIVTKTMKDNEILYRLRLEGLYGENEALALGDEIKRKFPAIQNFWLDQIGTEQSVSEHIAQQDVLDEKETTDPMESKDEITKTEEITQPVKSTTSSDKRYEVQLMASSNYAKIEETKAALARLGYQTKIINLQEGKKIVYRLRLKDMYSKERGTAIGEKIIRESPLVSGYWLDEMKDGQSVPDQPRIAKSSQPQKKETPVYTGAKDFEIQLLANTKLDLVENRKRDLERQGYKAKILTVVINGTTYYRLRLADSYTQAQAKEIGEELKKKISFVQDYWVVKKSSGDRVYTPTSRTEKKEEPSKKVATQIAQPETQEQTSTEEMVSEKQMGSKIVDYSASCNANEVNIRTGPGTEYEIDPIGKLMQGITVFVVEEKGEWARFTITPNDESWSGWVRARYLDKN